MRDAGRVASRGVRQFARSSSGEAGKWLGYHGFAMRLALLLVITGLLLGCSGCLLLTVATTKSELLRSDDLQPRTSSRPANLDGTHCYVDQAVREVHKAH